MRSTAAPLPTAVKIPGSLHIRTHLSELGQIMPRQAPPQHIRDSKLHSMIALTLTTLLDITTYMHRAAPALM